MSERRHHWIRHNKQCRMPKTLVFLGAEWRVENGQSSDRTGYIHAHSFAASVWRKTPNGYRHTNERTGLSATDAMCLLSSVGEKRSTVWVFANRMAGIMAAIGAFTDRKNGIQKTRNWILSLNTSVLYCDIQGSRYTCCEAGNFCIGKASIGSNASEDVTIAESCVLNIAETALLCGFGNFGVTLPSIAWNCYRHRFMRTRILVHGVPDVLQLERRAYYGGQVYVGKEGDARCEVTQLDVNGLFAYCMQQYAMPRRIHSFSRSGGMDKLAEAIEIGTAAADVTIESDSEPYPVRINKDVVYAVGRFKTSLAGPELETALSRGHVKKCSFVAAYETANLFDEFFEWFGSLRIDAERRGVESLSMIAKAIPNALYGKFAAHDWGWHLDEERDAKERFGMYWDEDEKTKAKLWCRSVDNCVKVRRAEDEGSDSVPIVSACVAAAARSVMCRHRATAGKRNVFYQDTDSLFCNSEGASQIEAAGKIRQYQYGAFKRQGVPGSLVVNGPKSYTFCGKRIAAGLQANAIQLSQNVYEQKQYESPSTMLLQEPDGRIQFKTVRFTIRAGKRHYAVGPDGWTEPITLWDD